jgi:hypothetical protein
MIGGKLTLHTDVDVIILLVQLIHKEPSCAIGAPPP